MVDFPLPRLMNWWYFQWSIVVQAQVVQVQALFSGVFEDCQQVLSSVEVQGILMEAAAGLSIPFHHFPPEFLVSCNLEVEIRWVFGTFFCGNGCEWMTMVRFPPSRHV